jgi:hypothetical protein
MLVPAIEGGHPVFVGDARVSGHAAAPVAGTRWTAKALTITPVRPR